MKMLAGVIALVVGAGLAAQVGFNGGLKARVGHPTPAALISFATGTIALIAYGLATRTFGPFDGALGGPWWIWMGGLVGAVYVVSAAAYGPRLGAAAWMGLVIAGQVLASLAFDHFGMLEFAVHPLNAGRVVGAVLLLAGVVMVLVF
jgi:transporter family-2 protein